MSDAFPTVAATKPSERSLELQTASKAVASQLRLEIQAGALIPGSRLRQGEVARRFGVSTTPVREALASLQAEGLVRIDPHRGAIVYRPSVNDVREAFEIRIALEALALSIAASQLSKAELDELQQLVDRMTELESYEEWVLLNDEFHNRLYAASRRLRLGAMIESLRQSARYYIQLYVVRHFRDRTADAEHQAILDACRQQDVEGAVAALRSHLQRTSKDVTEFLAVAETDGTRG